MTPNPNPDTKPLIIVLGQTGTGKSTFIAKAIRAGATRKPEISHGLVACTKWLEEYDAIYSGEPPKSVQLVDTPGFNDEDMTEGDHQKLGKIITWLKDRQLNGDRPALIIYLLDITQCKLIANSTTMGPTSVPRPRGVVFVTTKWITENNEVQKGREKELEKQLANCVLKPFYNTNKSAQKILEDICSESPNSRANWITQKEIVEKLERVQKGIPPVTKGHKGKRAKFFSILFGAK